MIHVNFIQNCTERHFPSSLEHHANAFGSSLSALSIDCSNDTHNVSHNPFLPHTKVKMKQRK